MIDSKGYCLIQLRLPHLIRERVEQRRWVELDQAIAKEVVPGGIIFDSLLKFTQFSKIEFIISIRSSLEYPDEDGIWHDDGSRVLAFSLSLTLNPAAIEGGILELRNRTTPNAPIEAIQTPSFGTMIVFATGYQGFEHKINRVTQGERIIIAGWCT